MLLEAVLGRHQQITRLDPLDDGFRSGDVFVHESLTDRIVERLQHILKLVIDIRVAA
jgi:hypothetical protein